MAAAGIDPDHDVRLIVVPPPQMAANLESKNIDGYCVGEPWKPRAVMGGIGHTLITSYQIWNNSPEKVFGVTREWAERHPNTDRAILMALGARRRSRALATRCRGRCVLRSVRQTNQRNLRRGKHAHRGSPGARAAVDVQPLGRRNFGKAERSAVDDAREQAEREHLSAVRVSGQLQVHAAARFRRDDRLVLEQHGEQPIGERRQRFEFADARRGHAIFDGGIVDADEVDEAVQRGARVRQ
jgi:hypothetical protein